MIPARAVPPHRTGIKRLKQRRDSIRGREFYRIPPEQHHHEIRIGHQQSINQFVLEEREAEGEPVVRLAVLVLIFVQSAEQHHDISFPRHRDGLGAGVLLAEIQQSSDITYRIYDYDRRDAAGNPRELHTALAEEAIDFSDASPKSNPTTPGKSDMEEIASCGHFAVKRLVIDEPTPLYFDSGSFTVIMCLGGSATLTYAGGRTDLPRGHSLLLPATLNAVVINGNATILTARYPSPASRPAVKKHQ